jgi:hypothetical protein
MYVNVELQPEEKRDTTETTDVWAMTVHDLPTLLWPLLTDAVSVTTSPLQYKHNYLCPFPSLCPFKHFMEDVKCLTLGI